ncbi:hypothetical protein [Arenibacterium halophilum]|uniref:Uncharacterized protein n=1 Tax=Arenibacterium halophilum TaxID=2583821 RepID=A0ABY2X9H7_9RHOB|nr:hypothetical protein [Arenibacterium halophilum]TMV12996.1 hypothetical protein FGK64_09395 [Arenibacterium halophilum]
MQPPNELQRAEIMDWWEAAQDHISKTIPDRLPALYYKVDQKIDELGWYKTFSRKAVRTNELNPIVEEWTSKLYAELTHDLDESFKASAEEVEGNGQLDKLSYSEIGETTATVVFSVAPVAAVPFASGGLAVAGTTVLGFSVGATGLAVVPVVALAGAAIAAAAGPAFRNRNLNRLKQNFRQSIHKWIDGIVLGDPEKPKANSLKRQLQKELEAVARKRLELIE